MLSQDQIDSFRSKGYLVVEDLLDGDTLASIRSEYADRLDGLYAGWHAAGLVSDAPEGLDFRGRLDRAVAAGVEWYQPLDISLPHTGISADTPFHFGPAVFDMITHPNVLDMVEQLIGPEISSNPIQHVRIKPPQRQVDGAENRAHIVRTDWHQDQGVTLEEADDTTFVTVWLAITDATVENGCLQVAEASADRLLPHCPDRTQLGIPDSVLPRDRARPTPVRAGGAVLFHPLTPHGSLENRSGDYRWSFDLRYHVTGQPSGRSQFPEFVARSRSHPEKVLTDWRVWRQMWQDTRARLAVSPHVEQHRWDGSAPVCA